MEDFVSFDFERLPPREAYGLLTAFVQPRPIAFVSSVSIDGVPNLAPFSFFMAGGSNPPSVCYSPTLSSKGLEKDSLRNVRETREFVINTVHRSMAVQMNDTSGSFPAEVSEWNVTNFTPIPSEVVRPPRVAESFAQMECRLFQIVEHGAGPTAARYIIGEVVRFHAWQSFFDGGKLKSSRIEAVGRMGGSHYIDTGSLSFFEMERPP